MMRILLLCCVLMPMFSSAALAAAEVKEVVSASGIRAWLVEEHSLPLVAVKIAFRESGVAYDPPGKEGRAGMTAAMLMEGAGELDSKAFNQALESNAIELGFAIDEDLFRASLSTISDKRDMAFSLLGSALTKPRFDASALDRVRSQNLSMLVQQEKQPTYLLQRKWETTLFGTHPYANPSLGTPESVKALTAQDLQEFVRRYLTRENMVVAVTGDITPEELVRQLDTHFGSLPTQYDGDVKLTDVTVPATAQQVVVESDIPQTMVLFGTQGIKREDPMYYAAHVMNHMLGGGNLNSKLIQEIREKRGLAYAVDSQTQPRRFVGGRVCHAQ
jgi:zinc protease